MPVFHFHTDKDHDVDGIELPDLASAKCEAVKLAGRLICDEADLFWTKAEWSMTVTDDRGLTLFQLQIVGTDAPVTWASGQAGQPSPST